MQVTPLVGGPSADSFEGEANKFAQNHVVTLPSKQCDNCYLRCEPEGSILTNIKVHDRLV